MHWFLDPITKHYFDFNGRVTRQQYWMFVLFYFIVGIALGIVLGVVLGILGLQSSRLPLVVSYVYFFSVVLPWAGLMVRRLHDIGQTGWWVAGFFTLAVLVKIAAWALDSGYPLPTLVELVISLGFFALLIIMIVFWSRKGTAGANQYGADPAPATATVPPVPAAEAPMAEAAVPSPAAATPDVPVASEPAADESQPSTPDAVVEQDENTQQGYGS